MFLKRLQGGHRQIRRSEDFEEEQATRVIGEEQPGQDMVALRIPLSPLEQEFPSVFLRVSNPVNFLV